MRIFVTGVSGFIGRHFAEHAARAGHEIVGLLRAPADDATGPLIEARYGDILDPASLETALAGADCVCHFAAAFKEGHADEAFFHRVNVEGSLNLLAAAAKAGVKRFVLCSTAGIYGRCVDGVIDETRPPHPWNAYERSKLAAEQQVRRSAAEHGIEYVILRPSVVYGPGDRRLAKLFRNAARGRFPLFGPGRGRRHMVYVADLADAFLRACTRHDAASREMIVAGPEAVPLREILQTLADLSNRSSHGPRLPLRPMLLLAGITEDVCRLINVNPPLHRRRMDFYLNDAVFDCTLARAVLAWEPKVSLREGLAATLQASDRNRTAAEPRLAQTIWLGEALSIGALLEVLGARHLLG